MRRRLGGSLAACAALLVLTAAKPGPASWYDKLWRSVQQADANPESTAK